MAIDQNKTGLQPGSQIGPDQSSPLTSPSTPVGASIGGANEDSAKMAGTPAQTTRAQLDRVEPPKTLEELVRETDKQPLLTEDIGEQRKQQVTQLTQAFPALANLDTQFRELVMDALISRNASLGSALSEDTVRRLLPADATEATVTALLNELRAVDEEGRILSYIDNLRAGNDSDPELSRIFKEYNIKPNTAYEILDPTASLTQQMLDNLDIEVTLGTLVDQVGVLGLGVENEQEYLETNFGPGWRDLNWAEVKSAISSLRREFRDVYELRQIINNPGAPAWARDLAKRTLRELGAVGVITAEDKLNNLELQIADGDTITIGDQTFTIEEMTDDPAFVEKIVQTLNDPVALKNLQENPDTANLATWAIANANMLERQYALHGGGDAFSAVDSELAGGLDFDSLLTEEDTEFQTLKEEGIPSEFIFATVGGGDLTPEEVTQVRIAYAQDNAYRQGFSVFSSQQLSVLGLDLNSAAPLNLSAETRWLANMLAPEITTRQNPDGTVTIIENTKFVPTNLIAFVSAVTELVALTPRDQQGMQIVNLLNEDSWNMVRGMSDPEQIKNSLGVITQFSPSNIVDATGNLDITFVQENILPAGDITLQQFTGSSPLPSYTPEGMDSLVLDRVYDPATGQWSDSKDFGAIEIPSVSFPPELSWVDKDGDGKIDKDVLSTAASLMREGEELNPWKVAEVSEQLKEALELVNAALEKERDKQVQAYLDAKNLAESQEEFEKAQEEVNALFPKDEKGNLLPPTQSPLSIMLEDSFKDSVRGLGLRPETEAWLNNYIAIFRGEIEAGTGLVGPSQMFANELMGAPYYDAEGNAYTISADERAQIVAAITGDWEEVSKYYQPVPEMAASFDASKLTAKYPQLGAWWDSLSNPDTQKLSYIAEISYSTTRSSFFGLITSKQSGVNKIKFPLPDLKTLLPYGPNTGRRRYELMEHIANGNVEIKTDHNNNSPIFTIFVNGEIFYRITAQEVTR